ncbi:MAG: PEP-CTERM sorting domain-containing protein [Fimbriimonadia bacterium]|jgi:hypothetical protein
MKHIRILMIAAALAVGGVVQAQTKASFLPLDSFSDIFVSPGAGTFEYILSLGPNPTITYLGIDYDVDLVFGFWAISDSGDLAASGVAQNGWSYHESSYDLAGWKDPSKSAAVYPNGSLSFSYTAIDTSKIDDFGMHIRVVGALPDGANTAHFRLVPEPGSLAAILVGLGSLGTLRRLRTRR